MSLYPCAYKVFSLAYAASDSVCPWFPIGALQFKLLIVPWLEVDVSVSASFLASDVLSFWFEVLGANVVGDVVCVLSCEVLFFSQTASGILLCSVCNQFGDASVIRCFASLFQTAIISMLQVWLEKLRLQLLFHLLCVCCWRAGDGLPLLQLVDGIGTYS